MCSQIPRRGMFIFTRDIETEAKNLYWHELHVMKGFQIIYVLCVKVHNVSAKLCKIFFCECLQISFQKSEI